MGDFYLQAYAKSTSRYLALLALLLGSLLCQQAQAQTQPPAWVVAKAVSAAPSYLNRTRLAVATDATGNVLLASYFSGTLTLGSTTLVSAGGLDMFIAKYVPTTNTWAWAVRAGGTGTDVARNLVVSGSNIYLTGVLTNTTSNANNVRFGDTANPAGTVAQYGASTTNTTNDLVVAKYVDLGTSATFAWSQVGGGTGSDGGEDIAVSGSNVYVVGTINNNLADAASVRFGGTGATAGTSPQAGASPSQNADIIVAKYIDTGASATLGWTQVAGGTAADNGYGIVADEVSVYITGNVLNSGTNYQQVLFGGTGTTPGTVVVPGISPFTSTLDLLVAKYFDNGNSATLAWAQVGGGTSLDSGFDIALSGSSVYVTGQIYTNNTNDHNVVFGGTVTMPATLVQAGASASAIQDAVVVKYTDNGTSATAVWSQVVGGTDGAYGYGVAVQGSYVYLVGTMFNNLANGSQVVLGGSGLTLGTVPLPGMATAKGNNLFVAGYHDWGTTATVAWARAGGGGVNDEGQSLATAGARLYVVGQLFPPGYFDSFTLSTTAPGASYFLAALDMSSALATRPSWALSTPHLYPNPALGAATLSGATPHAAVHILDALGRRVAVASADASGTATLPDGLAPGLYVVRTGTSTVRWAVE